MIPILGRFRIMTSCIVTSYEDGGYALGINGKRRPIWLYIGSKHKGIVKIVRENATTPLPLWKACYRKCLRRTRLRKDNNSVLL